MVVGFVFNEEVVSLLNLKNKQSKTTTAKKNRTIPGVALNLRGRGRPPKDCRISGALCTVQMLRFELFHLSSLM